MRAVAQETLTQSDALDHVMLDLESLSKITESNAKMVAEAVMAADDMRGQALRLRQVVDGLSADRPQVMDPPPEPGPTTAPAISRRPVEASSPSLSSAGVDYF